MIKHSISEEELKLNIISIDGFIYPEEYAAMEWVYKNSPDNYEFYPRITRDTKHDLIRSIA